MHRFPTVSDIVTYPGEEEYIVVVSNWTNQTILVNPRDDHRFEATEKRNIVPSANGAGEWEQSKIVFIKQVRVKTKGTTIVVIGDN